MFGIYYKVKLLNFEIMKYLFSLLLVVIILFSISCKKDLIQESQSNDKLLFDKPEKLYRLVSCAYTYDGVAYSGFECALGAYKQCLINAECQPIEYNGEWLPLPKSFPSSWGFTQEEEDNWDLGYDVIKNTDKFITDHYNFFIFMYENGFTLHPDTLMKYNEE
jgi:hypothetical protein